MNEMTTRPWQKYIALQYNVDPKLFPGKPFKVFLELQNLHPQNSFYAFQIRVNPGGYFQPSATPLKSQPPYSKEIYTLQVNVKTGERRLYEMTKDITLEIIDDAGEVIYSYNVEVNISYFLGPLYSIELPCGKDHFINVSLIGPPGAGKSSYINSVHSMFHPKRLVKPRPTGNDAVHISRDAWFSVIPNTHIRFIDLWGITSTNYQGSQLELFLSGALTNGYKMVDETAILDVKIDPENKVHAVMLFVTPQLLDDQNMMDRLKEVVKLCRSMKINPGVIVTKLDELDKTLRSNMDYNNQHVQATIEKASAQLGIDIGKIVPVINYTEEHDKCFMIEKFIFSSVQEIVDQAEDNQYY